MRFDTPVEKLAAAAGGGAVAITAGETFTAPVAVVAAGPWIAPLLAGLVELPTLTVTQQQVFHFAPARGREAEPWPVFIHFDGSGYRYGLPGGRDGGAPGAVKIGEHDPGPATTAAGRDFRIDPAARDRVRAFVADRLPGLDPAPGQRGELPLHVDRERGLHPRPAGRRAVRGRVALLGPRREVRPAAWRDHRRPGRGPPRPRTRASPSPRTWPRSPKVNGIRGIERTVLAPRRRVTGRTGSASANRAR